MLASKLSAPTRPVSAKISSSPLGTSWSLMSIMLPHQLCSVYDHQFHNLQLTIRSSRCFHRCSSFLIIPLACYLNSSHIHWDTQSHSLTSPFKPGLVSFIRNTLAFPYEKELIIYCSVASHPFSA